MFAEFNLNHSYNNASTQVLFSETVLINELLCVEGSTILDQCGVFILVDELLTRGEMESDPLQSKKTISLAKRLMGSVTSSKITVSPSKDHHAQEFFEKILQKVEASLENQSNMPISIRNSAAELKGQINELFDSFTKSWEDRSISFDSVHRFFASLVDFTRLTLLERLKSMTE